MLKWFLMIINNKWFWNKHWSSLTLPWYDYRWRSGGWEEGSYCTLSALHRQNNIPSRQIWTQKSSCRPLWQFNAIAVRLPQKPLRAHTRLYNKYNPLLHQHGESVLFTKLAITGGLNTLDWIAPVCSSHLMYSVERI